MQYTPANNVFTVSGGASVAVSGIGGLSVSFGYGSGASALPGLVISNGTLASVMNMTVNGSFTVGQVAITASSLDFTYATATSDLCHERQRRMSTSLELGGLERDLRLHGEHHRESPGLVVAGGTLQSLDMTIDVNVSRSPSVTFTATGLRIDLQLRPTSQFAFAEQARTSASASAASPA